MRRWFFCMLAAAVLPCTAAGQPRGEAILGRQVAVLEELAEEGVVEAYYQLALLAERYPRDPVFERMDSAPFLAVAAASGHKQAVRSLAFTLLRRDTPAARREAATLVAAAAILGDDQATVDLGLLPRMTAVTDADMVDGFGRALARMADGRVVDCAVEAVACPPPVEAFAGLDVREIVYARNLAESGPYPDLASIRRVFAAQTRRYTAFSATEYDRFRAERAARNRPLRARMAQKREEAARRAQASGARRAYLDRKANREEAARRYLWTTLERDLEQYREALAGALERVNRHRSRERRYTLERLLGRLREAAE